MIRITLCSLLVSSIFFAHLEANSHIFMGTLMLIFGAHSLYSAVPFLVQTDGELVAEYKLELQKKTDKDKKQIAGRIEKLKKSLEKLRDASDYVRDFLAREHELKEQLDQAEQELALIRLQYEHDYVQIAAKISELHDQAGLKSLAGVMAIFAGMRLVSRPTS